ncbi:MAG TPA: hypothetical protein VF406_07660 [Thermodesulfobacteriota bacterium]
MTGRQLRRSLRIGIEDALHNLRYRGASRRILVVRHAARYKRIYNSHFLAWVRARVPAAAPLFELRRLPCRVGDWRRYALFLPWLQDPLNRFDPRLYRYAREMERRCEALGIPVVNPVDALSRSVKSVASEIMRAAGVRTPRMVPIADVEVFRKTLGGLAPPVIVREDDRHRGASFLVERPADLDRVPFERLSAPVAVEFVDVRSPDGLYRAYRYLAIGDRGFPCFLAVSPSWEARGEDEPTDTAVEEELAFLNGDDPNHDALQHARRALGFDIVAFDYSYDAEGRLVVWEANPFPTIWGQDNYLAYMRYADPFIERIYVGLLTYYLERAGMAASIPMPVRGAGAALDTLFGV